MKLNGCPMRRINQNYLLATQTSIDVSGVKIPDTVNDDYFKRAKAPKVSLNLTFFFRLELNELYMGKSDRGYFWIRDNYSISNVWIIIFVTILLRI